LVQRLNALYDTHPDSAALEAGRAEAGAWARAQLQGPVGAQLRTLRVGKLAERPVNNARLIGARIYRTRLDLFESWYQSHNRDVRRSVTQLGRLMEGAEGDSAYARLEAAVGETKSDK